MLWLVKMLVPILIYFFSTHIVSGYNHHHHHYNLTLSSSFETKYDNVTTSGDLRIKHLDEHRRLGTVPNFQLWDNWYKNGYYWIRVYIDTSYSDESQQTIKASFRSLQWRSKVIKFKFLQSIPNNSKRPYLKVVNNEEGCWSWLGRNYDAELGQDITLEEDWCTDSRTIQHEILHAMGFYHEQNRPDRDKYIEIIYENVKEEGRDKFDVWDEIDSLEVPYDLNSIMHYGQYDYSISYGVLSTIRPLNNAVIGELESASWNDIVQLRLLYQCEKSIGPRTLSEFNTAPCTKECRCWKKRPGCKNMDELCKGNLVCHKNTCKSPKDVPKENESR